MAGVQTRRGSTRPAADWAGAIGSPLYSRLWVTKGQP